MSAIGIVGLLVAVLLIAVFSPILALRTIQVDGVSAIPASTVQRALSSQLGTPLALTREIGGDVILLEARDPQTLAPAIVNRFHVNASVMDKHVRIEIENGHRFVPDVVEAFPGEIQSLSVSKPTLEDVFIHRTGHRFWNEEAEKVSATEKGKKKKH